MSEAAEDPGRPLVHEVAALERTALAWERTAVSLALVGTLLLKVVEGGRFVEAAGLALVAVSIGVVLVVVPVGYRRARAKVDPRRPAAPFADPDPWRGRFLLVTAAVVSLTVVALALDIWLVGIG